ncbi:MAG TPA: CopG family transcriptional regulator [Candidatus Ignatzschineria merdigallinarum]|uniref:CopG family transcriptional regulator n=1 Tax=Candidatus Ignatzschineria merdigallinarum TaxID=2838621 RepID=A0A9D1Q5W9_9GAMM|nr:CopG family transcriptional regulator [Candidatus Ignatzschineria merdigallinarum]
MMKKQTLLLVATGLLALSMNSAFAENSDLPEMTLYKDPYCGCCTGHAEYLKEQGVNVKMIDHPNISQVKMDLGSYKGASCHTIVMGDYVIEGHVPIASIRKLWNEQPDIKGIALPGMPLNSPGMGPEKKGSLRIMQIENNADVTTVFNIE